MRKIVVILLFIITSATHAQSHQAFEDGEWFRFRIHYGIFNASYATLEVKEDYLNDKPVYHVVGKGKSTGLLHLFFKVNDNYETYIDRKTGSPYKFIRQIDEGGYTKDLEIDFNHQANTAFVHDKKANTKKTYDVADNVHDMLSAFYYLRNNLDFEGLEEGDMISLNMFFDDENYEFKLQYLGPEVIKTKMGKIASIKFRPYVMAGRVFEEKESLTLWVSDDDNRMPVKIKADLAVGSLDASLDGFKGLKHPLRIIMD